MRGCTHRAARLVERAFVRGLSSRQRLRLRAHLATCEACRQRWDRLAIVERRLGGPHLTATMIDDIAERVITPVRASRRRVMWATAGGLLTAAAIALVVVPRDDGAGSTLAPRGTPGGGRTPGVRVFCVAGDREHVLAEVRMVSSAQVPLLRCSIGDDLQLAYTTPPGKALTMIAFGRMDRSIFPYAPAAATSDPLALQADRVDELVGWSTPLTDHAPGSYDVIVRIFDRPVSTSEAIGDRRTPLVELRTRLEVVSAGGLVDAP